MVGITARQNRQGLKTKSLRTGQRQWKHTEKLNSLLDHFVFLFGFVLLLFVVVVKFEYCCLLLLILLRGSEIYLTTG